MLLTLSMIVFNDQFKNTGIPLLDPIKDLKVNSEKYDKLVIKLKDVEKQLKNNAMASQPRFQEYYDAHKQNVFLRDELTRLTEELQQHQFLTMSDDLKSMKRLLKRLDFVDKQNVVQLKGRLACEISTADEILLTETIFANVFDGLEPRRLVALLSCFSMTETHDNSLMPEDEVVCNSFERMKDIAKGLVKVMRECKLPVDEEEYVASLKPDLMDLALKWCDGVSFRELMEGTEMFEGSVVRTLRRLEELLREVQTAAHNISNTQLEASAKEGRNMLRRGVIFAASLYL